MTCVIDKSKIYNTSYYDSKFVPLDEQFTSKVEPLVIRNFIPAEICAQYIADNTARITKKTPAPSKSANASSEIRLSYRNDDLIINPNNKSLINYVSVDAITKPINEYWGTKFKYSLIPEFQLQYSVYSKGQYCKPHHDIIIRGNKLIRPTRRLTVLLYLNRWSHEENELDTFSGGELQFGSVINKYGNCYHVQPSIGTLVVFPSTPLYVHNVSTVTSGYRHTIVFFLQIDHD